MAKQTKNIKISLNLIIQESYLTLINIVKNQKVEK